LTGRAHSAPRDREAASGISQRRRATVEGFAPPLTEGAVVGTVTDHFSRDGLSNINVIFDRIEHGGIDWPHDAVHGATSI